MIFPALGDYEEKVGDFITEYKFIKNIYFF